MIRKFDPWTVFKVSLLLQVVFSLAVLIGLAILWSLLIRVGIPQALDEFLALISLIDEDTVFFNNGSRFLRVAVFFSVAGGIMMTLLSTLGAVFYNLTSDVMGGVEVVMLEETLRVPAGVPTPPPTYAASDPVVLSPGQADLPTQIH